MSELRHDAAWTDDCQGKKDFDAELVSLSTRYWPRGGGFFTFDTATGTFGENQDRPEIRPSATSSLMLRVAGDEYLDLCEERFEGETEEEVKAAVEAWAAERFAELVALLRTKYNFPESVTP